MKMTAENVNLWYGDFHALKGVFLNMEVNQVTALIGPSGCGKSTFLKSLNRMNDLVEGCRINGQRLPGRSRIFTPGLWTSTSCASAWAWSFRSPTPSP